MTDDTRHPEVPEPTQLSLWRVVLWIVLGYSLAFVLFSVLVDWWIVGGIVLGMMPCQLTRIFERRVAAQSPFWRNRVRPILFRAGVTLALVAGFWVATVHRASFTVAGPILMLIMGLALIGSLWTGLRDIRSALHKWSKHPATEQ